MHAVHVLHLFSISFFNLDHRNILLSASIFEEPGCPKYSESTTDLSSSSGSTTLSPTNNKPNRSVISKKTLEKFSGVLFTWLLETHVFRFFNFWSTAVLSIRVCTSLKLGFFQVFLRFFLVLVCRSHDWFEYDGLSFRRYRRIWGRLLGSAMTISHPTFFGAGDWFGFNRVLFLFTWLFFTRTGFRFTKLEINSAPPALFSFPKMKTEVNCSHLISSSFVRLPWEAQFSV